MNDVNSTNGLIKKLIDPTLKQALTREAAETIIVILSRKIWIRHSPDRQTI